MNVADRLRMQRTAHAFARAVKRLVQADGYAIDLDPERAPLLAGLAFAWKPRADEPGDLVRIPIPLAHFRPERIWRTRAALVHAIKIGREKRRAQPPPEPAEPPPNDAPQDESARGFGGGMPA